MPRNDIGTQALQPTRNQVEWAVDMAVRGNLRSGYLTQGGRRSQTGIGTIDPQSMLPVPKLNTGGRIPAQVEPGIVAQDPTCGMPTAPSTARWAAHSRPWTASTATRPAAPSPPSG